jgi:phosphatidylinositol alpha-1,6-mannosyltransferase
MRCLLVASYFSPISGGSAVVYETLCRFAPEGSMVVLAPWRRYENGEEIEGWREYDATAPYPIYRTELLRPLELAPPRNRIHALWRQFTIDMPLKVRVFLEALRIIKKHDIDVVCIGELNSGSWLGIACQRLLGSKMISYIHGEEVTAETQFRSFGQQRRTYLRHADAVVAVSNFTKNALMRLMAVPAEKITLIHNGVNTERFTPGMKSNALISRHNLQGKKIILTVGRIVPRKGLDTVIRALPRVLQKFPNAHYLIVGEGEYRSTLAHLVDNMGVADHVTFTGRVVDKELVDYYRLCDVFAMPNRDMPGGDTEGFGLVFLEANACGKPVIAGRAGGAVEAVKDEENGLLVDGWSIEEVIEALIRLLTDRALYQRISNRGLEIALESNSKVKAEEFYSLCQDLVRR